MRVVDATLSTGQLQLAGEPARSLVIGSAPDTADVSAYVVAYDYEEVHDNDSGLTVRLDNSGGAFNSLTGDLASVTPGAAVELKRGVRVEGTSYLAELPRTWIESVGYEYLGGVSYCVLECIDWRGKLARWRASSEQSWSSPPSTTILEWLLTQVGLTRASGAMTALTLDYAVRLRESGEAALDRLVGKLPEYLYAGLDGEVKWREIDGGDASAYTFGWNASHAVLLVEAAASAWQVNSVRVLGRAGKSGLAEDATQIAAVGRRRWTIYDDDLDSDAGCAQRAQAELDLYQAEATEATVVCRPCHGLELFDVVTVASPPWGGLDVVGRVIRFREEWNMNGRWHQVIGLGRVKDKDPGNQPAKKSASKGRQSRRRIWRCPVLRREPSDPWLVPVGGIVMWSGAADDVPAGWVLCDGSNGTPDLRGRFIVGAGDAYTLGDTGGEASSDLRHTHGPGSLATDSDSHTHGPGSLATDSDSHKHGFAHDIATGGESAAVTVASGTGAEAARGGSLHHVHTVSGSTLGSEMENDSHGHDVDSGATASESHSHDVDSGVTASGGSAGQENRPPFYALAFIMRCA